MRRAPYVAVPEPNFGCRYATPPESWKNALAGDHATAPPYVLRSFPEPKSAPTVKPGFVNASCSTGAPSICARASDCCASEENAIAPIIHNERLMCT